MVTLTLTYMQVEIIRRALFRMVGRIGEKHPIKSTIQEILIMFDKAMEDPVEMKSFFDRTNTAS